MKTIAFLALAMLILPSCATGPRGFPPTGGIQNFDIVDAKLWRGAQPNHGGLKWLSEQGVTTVINLRGADAWADEERVCVSLGMKYFNLPMNGLSAPTQGAVERALKIIKEAQGTVMVHCAHGADRTGTVVACYRVRHGMSNADALNDAVTHGLSDWLVGMHSFIKHFR